MLASELLFGTASNEEVFVLIGGLIFMIIATVIGEFVVHRSCFVARKTGKKICACWDCKNPCELSKYKKEEQKDA